MLLMWMKKCFMVMMRFIDMGDAAALCVYRAHQAHLTLVLSFSFPADIQAENK